jgi:hypothetical protein
MSENKVKINTSDTDWLTAHAIDEPVTYGTDIKGVVYFSATITVGRVDHVRFAGCDMIRFDLGGDAPADHSRRAMYPAAYLVS